MVPLVPLSEFSADEEQLFARGARTSTPKHPEIGQLLPFVPRHFVIATSFPVHDFVMAKHKNEMLVKGVKERKRDVAVMKPAVNRNELK